MACALVSALSGVPVSGGRALTGGARRLGRIVLPGENEADLDEAPPAVREALRGERVDRLAACWRWRCPGCS